MQFLIIAIIAVMATTAVAAPKTKEDCRQQVGKEAGEGEGGKSGTTRSQLAAFDECMKRAK